MFNYTQHSLSAQAFSLQKSLFSPAEEAQLYHQTTSKGRFALCIIPETIDEYQQYLADYKAQLSFLPGGGNKPRSRDSWRQRIYPLFKLKEIEKLINPTRDTYISQAEFWIDSRTASGFARVSVQFLDFDYYNSSLAGLPPEAAAEQILEYCLKNKIVLPSIIVSSGRGLYLKWFLDSPVPTAGRRRWELLQRWLFDRFAAADFGVDPAALDVSRVLRVVDTTNTKSGEMCRVIWPASKDIISYSFDALFDLYAPVERSVLEAQRRAKRDAKQAAIAAGVSAPVVANSIPSTGNLVRRGVASLNLARFADIQTLIILRARDGKSLVGLRQHLVFYGLNFLFAADLRGLRRWDHEYYGMVELIRRHCPQSRNWTPNSMDNLKERIRMMRQGQTIEWAGRQVSPMYQPSNDYLINLLQITDDEQRHLQTIISDHIVDERRRERQRADYAPEKAAKAVKKMDRDADILRLYRSGVSQIDIAKKHNITPQTVRAIIRGLLSADDLTRK